MKQESHDFSRVECQNPVIDKAVKEMFNVPEHYRLIAQMPFGGIVQEAEPKEKEDITQRVKVFNG